MTAPKHISDLLAKGEGGLRRCPLHPDPLAPRLSAADRARLAELMAAAGGPMRIVRILTLEAAEVTRVPVEAILGRDRRYSDIRHVVIHAAHEAGLSRGEIARVMGLDPSSVMHAVRREAERRRAAA